MVWSVCSTISSEGEHLVLFRSCSQSDSIISSSDTSNTQRSLAEILARADVDESGALKLPSLSSLSSIASLGISGLSILGDIFGGGSKNSTQQTRELLNLLARDDADESGALKLPSLSSLGSIASLGFSGLGILGDLFGSDKDSQNQTQRRELIQLLTRTEVDESGALTLPSLSDAAGLASIAGGVVSVLHDIFGG